MPDDAMHKSLVVFTVGHSNHPLEVFIDLLRSQGIELVVDVRSSPYSRYTTHFNADSVKPALHRAGIRYLFLGTELGGRPQAPEFYDAGGYVLYWRIAATPAFVEGIARLLNLAAAHRLAMLCGEEDPTDCHRRLLVGKVLGGRGVEVRHLRGDGSVQSEDQVAAAEKLAKGDGARQMLFDFGGTPEWKSTQSVLPGKQPRDSSEP